MGFSSEFKEFAMKGNVVDLAVGVIIGAAFGKIADSLVKDLIMPIVGKIFGGLDFSNSFILLSQPVASILFKLGLAAISLWAASTEGAFIHLATNPEGPR